MVQPRAAPHLVPAGRMPGRLPARLLFSQLGHSLIRCPPALTAAVAPAASSTALGITLPPACRGRRRPRRRRGSAVAPTASFVGRQDELAILSERFSEAARGRPQVVYLEGEAGSGKSTLLSRFLGSLSDAVVLQAGGDEDESLLSYGVVDQ